MKASEAKLQALIEGTKQYVVPLFQRAYSWDRKEWEMLWNDLMELCEMENPRTHFMGSMVTMPTSSVPEGIAKYLLIDGQQRLTTIIILLTLLRDKAKKGNQEELAEEINDTLLVNRYKKGTDYYKLQPTQIDRDAFHDLIHFTTKTTQNKLIDAYQFFERQLRRSGKDGEVLKKVISNNVSVISIVLDHEDDPYLVFESLNAKGRPLTQSDLIRNYFFMKIHTNEQENIYAQYWEPMQMALGDSLTECIRHYLMKDSTFVKQGDVYYFLYEQKRVTGTTPKTMIILGQRFEVQSWRDVLERTINTIAELEPEKFGLIMKQFPRSVGRDKKKFRETRELQNGAFIEVQRSAKDIQRFCFQVLEAIELSSEDLKVEIVEKLENNTFSIATTDLQNVV